METIQIPHVELVDIFGRNLGIFDEDPNWWQKVNSKSEKNEIYLDSNNEKIVSQNVDAESSDLNKTAITGI